MCIHVFGDVLDGTVIDQRITLATYRMGLGWIGFESYIYRGKSIVDIRHSRVDSLPPACSQAMAISFQDVHIKITLTTG